MLRRPLLILLVALLVLAGAATWWWTRTPTVSAVEVKAAPLVRTLQFSGRVSTSSRVDVGSTLTGRIARVAATEGGVVRRGDVLAQLETDELQAALAQAQANERQAAARLAGLRSTGRRGTQAAVAQAESVLAAAQADLSRQQALVDQGFISAARLDEARRATAVAQAQLDGARAQAAATGERGSEVAQAEAQRQVAAASTALAQARLAQATITAPTDGRILLRSVEPGQIVQPGRAIITLALATPVQLKAQVDERYLDQLAQGLRAFVVADAYPTQRFSARVATVAPLVDAQRGAVEVKLDPEPPLPAFLREDMTLSIEVETARRERTLSVPSSALRVGAAAEAKGEAAAARAHVLVVREGRVQAQAVRTGLRTVEAVEIVEGLSEGDVVLLGPALAVGSRVRPDTKTPLTKATAPADGAAATMSTSMGR